MGLLQSLFAGNQSNKQVTYAKFLDSNTPIFSQFGHSIYTSDVVQVCIDRIATSISKLQPRHIRTDSKGLQVTPPSNINRLFKFGPNELMTTRAFLEKIIWLYHFNYNSFIFPAYQSMQDRATGVTWKDYKAFYPLNPIQVDFLQDAANKIFVKLYFANGQNYTLAYSDIIHLRKRFSVNDVMGGGSNGQPDHTALLSVLTINDTVMQGVAKAVKASLNIRGIIKINSLLDDDKQAAERTRFEQAIEAGTTGILPMDLKGDFTPLTLDPKIIDKDTLQFLTDKVLNWFGVPLKIFNGDFDDAAWEAFQESTLNPIIIELNQAFSKTLFTERELQVGNEVQFYQQDLSFLSIKSKMELIKIAGEQGLLSDDQKLGILGMPPIPGGERYTQSLNYVDKTLINEYQMKKAGAPRVSAEPE
jgi:HK97 family phage portal protein